MAINDTAKRVQRSIFNAIRVILVREGYTPDITDTGTYGGVGGIYTKVNEAAWNAALQTIRTNKGFAVEVFSTSQTKGLKAVPRIVIIPRRTLPGDIGAPPQGVVITDPLDSLGLVRQNLPAQANHFYFDISLISNSSDQATFLSAVLAEAIGAVNYLKWYDAPNDEPFFIRQTSDFDLPDPTEGIFEEVYTYEVPDMFVIPKTTSPVSKLKEVKVDVVGVESKAEVHSDGTVTNGDSVPDGSVTVDGDGITYQ